MRFLSLSLGAACLCPGAFAFYPYHFKPDPNVDKGKVQARHVSNPDLSSLRMPIRRRPLKRDYQYNVIPAGTPSAANSAGVDQDGTDYSYFVSFTFGSSSKEYHMLVDSGASNTWVMASNCQSAACQTHNMLGTSESTTLKTTSSPFDISYGTGSVSGIIASDTVHVAGLSVPMKFGLGTKVSDDFKSYPMDGIVGLGRGDTTLPAIDAPTFLDNIFSLSSIKSKVFGLNLWRASDGGDNDGEITFGGYDSSKFTGNLAYINTVNNPDGFWEIPVDDALVNGKSIAVNGDRTALIDSGTSFVLMPLDDAEKFHDSISGSSRDGESFKVPCSWQGSAALVIGGNTYQISYKDIVEQSSNDGGQCNSNIIGRTTFGSSQWLVGDVFLKNVYTVFDVDKGRLGFGKKSSSSSGYSDGSSTTTSISSTTKTSTARQSTNTGTSTNPESTTSTRSSSTLPSSGEPVTTSSSLPSSSTPRSTSSSGSRTQASKSRPISPSTTFSTSTASSSSLSGSTTTTKSTSTSSSPVPSDGFIGQTSSSRPKGKDSDDKDDKNGAASTHTALVDARVLSCFLLTFAFARLFL